MRRWRKDDRVKIERRSLSLGVIEEPSRRTKRDYLLLIRRKEGHMGPIFFEAHITIHLARDVYDTFD